MTTIGFIGLGMMGQPMAHLLHAAGHALVIRDAVPAATARFAQEHAGVAVASGAADFAGCSVVFTMLPDSRIVDAVVGELAPHLPPGACIIDMSSADPNRTRALAGLLGERGIGLLDAPVSGGVKRAIAGTLSIMVGEMRTCSPSTCRCCSAWARPSPMSAPWAQAMRSRR